MTELTRPVFDDALAAEASPGLDLAALAALARIVRLDPVTGVVVVQNGSARISLHPDGTVRIDARRVVASADEDILLSAARIDLN